MEVSLLQNSAFTGVNLFLKEKGESTLPDSPPLPYAVEMMII
jgi:hypothetical protein